MRLLQHLRKQPISHGKKWGTHTSHASSQKSKQRTGGQIGTGNFAMDVGSSTANHFIASIFSPLSARLADKWRFCENHHKSSGPQLEVLAGLASQYQQGCKSEMHCYKYGTAKSGPSGKGGKVKSRKRSAFAKHARRATKCRAKKRPDLG
jgi:hypothetical protein